MPSRTGLFAIILKKRPIRRNTPHPCPRVAFGLNYGFGRNEDSFSIRKPSHVKLRQQTFRKSTTRYALTWRLRGSPATDRPTTRGNTNARKTRHYMGRHYHREDIALAWPSKPILDEASLSLANFGFRYSFHYLAISL